MDSFSWVSPPFQRAELKPRFWGFVVVLGYCSSSPHSIAAAMPAWVEMLSNVLQITGMKPVAARRVSVRAE